MELTEVLTKFWGIVLIISGSALLVNKRLLPEILKAKEKEDYLLLTGFVSLLIGSIHVAAYNYWELNARGLITLFGWLALIKGSIRLTFPELSKRAISRVGRSKALYYPLFIMLMSAGIYLLFIGFVQ